MAIVKLNQLVSGGPEADVFVLLVSREKLTTSTGKPYWRVTFRDDTREIGFPIWENTALFPHCDKQWKAGTHYKLRTSFIEDRFGGKLEIRRIREAVETDTADGFDPNMGIPHSRFEPEAMFNDILEILEQNVSDPGLLKLATFIFTRYREMILVCSAAMGKHHAHQGGFLEHTRNVLWTTVTLARRYQVVLPDLDPPLNVSAAAVGAALHDIGKLRELRQTPTGFEYTPEGNLIGHIVLGRDFVREAAEELREKDPEFQLDPELQLRVEHAILSHQRLPEWGSPKTNMTPESLLIHYADDIDAKYFIMKKILEDTPEGEEFSDTKNSMRTSIFKGIFHGSEE
ncbi:MAG: HD domain-containing protein [Planctomycetaceae bacterium]|nr:HD domain-containing protein [Planctomycetaceae bacterium]